MAEKYILIVEDDPFYSNIYKTKLAKEKLNAQMASNGDVALKIIKESGPPVLILLDLVMPGKDGFETLKDLKADAATKDIPVIVLSNLSQAEDIKRVMDMGATEYLIKANASIHDIVAKIRASLEA